MSETRLVALSIILLLLASISPVLPRTFSSGVSNGDYFVYHMYGVYNSTLPNIELLIPEFERNITDWTQISIESVYGSLVTQTYILHFKNSSELRFNFETDVDPQKQGEFQMSNKGVPLCAAYLNVGDKIPTVNITISGIVERNYSDGERELIYANWNQPDEYGEIYFDRETGMLVELERTCRFVNPVSERVVEKTDVLNLIDTNRWHLR